MQSLALTLVVSLVQTGTTWAESGSSTQWQSLMDKGLQAESLRHHREAVIWYKKAAREARQFGDHDTRLARTLHMMALCCDQECNYKSAITYAQESDRIYQLALWSLPHPGSGEGSRRHQWSSDDEPLSTWLDSMDNLSTLVTLYKVTGQYGRVSLLLHERLIDVQGNKTIDPLMKADTLTIYNDWLSTLSRH